MKNLFKLFILLIGTSVLFTSCLKDKNEYRYEPTAYLNVIHASPQSPRFTFYFEDYNQAKRNLGYTDNSGYLAAAKTGKRTLSVFNYGSDTKVLSKELELLQNRYYSIFVVDVPGKVDAVVLRDSTRSVAGDSIRIRFANMTPDVPAMDFYLKGKTEPLATNVSYKTATEFISLKRNIDMVFESKIAGQSNTIVASMPYNMSSGYAYTIYTTGLRGTTGDGRIIMPVYVHDYARYIYW